MKSNELRLGNLVKDRGNKVIRIDFLEHIQDGYDCKVGQLIFLKGDEVHPMTEYSDYAKPIKITEDLLIKLGFSCETIPGNQNEFRVYTKGQFTFNTNHGWWINGKQIKVQPKYIHRLQNLYFETEDVELQLTAL